MNRSFCEYAICALDRYISNQLIWSICLIIAFLSIERKWQDTCYPKFRGSFCRKHPQIFKLLVTILSFTFVDGSRFVSSSFAATAFIHSTNHQTALFHRRSLHICVPILFNLKCPPKCPSNERNATPIDLHIVRIRRKNRCRRTNPENKRNPKCPMESTPTL